MSNLSAKQLMIVAGFIGVQQVALANGTTELPSDQIGQLAEITVTAQKRSENAQTTPVAMSVYTAADIRREGITDISTLATSDTSLNMTQALGGAEPYLTIRGISSSDTTEIGDPAVGVATDGFFTNRTYDLLGSLFDVQRIEVLRGPQGTLYGRNTAGGVVNIITNKPGDGFAADAAVETGNYNMRDYTGMLNVPVSKSLQVRAAFSSQNHDGYRHLIVYPGLPPEGGDDQNMNAMRLEIAFEPFQHLNGLITYQSLQIGGTGGAYKLIPFVPNPIVSGDIVHALPAIGDTSTWNSYAPTWQSIDEKTYKLELSYDGLPGGSKIIYLGGYDNFQWHHSSPLNTFFGTPFTTSETFLQNEYPKTQSHELRIVSPNSGRLTWQGGVYYFEERSTNLDSSAVENPGATNATTLIEFKFPLVEATSRAVYGQGSYKLTHSVSVSAGARYTKDAKERTGVFNLNVLNVYGIPQAGSTRSSKTTGHLGVEWKPTAQMFEYAKVDTGYKAGGFTTCNPYGPETVTAYEVGSKNRLDNDRAQLNVAAFFNDYKNQQISTFVPSSVCISNSTVQNAGGSHIYGVEGDFEQLIDPIGKIHLAVTYLHARFTNFVAAPGLGAAVADCTPAANGNCQLAGNTLPKAPTITVSASVEHTWSLSNDLSLNGRAEGKYTSHQYYDAFNYPSTTSPGYAIANLYLDLEHTNWRVGLFVRNLTDKFYFTNMQEYYTVNAYSYSFGAPRTFGMRIEYSTQ